MKQQIWERWFLLSVFLFSAFFFVGTIEGSKDAFPDFLWGFIPSIINLAVCSYYGTKSSDR